MKKPISHNHVAIFDYVTRSTNAIGKCYLTLARLSPDLRFTIYSVESDVLPPNANWRGVKAMRRPLAALFLTYMFAAQPRLAQKKKSRSVTIQTETALWGADVLYMHFCHRDYIGPFYKAMPKSSVRSWLRLLDHGLHAAAEKPQLKRARKIVVPTQSLKAALVSRGANECSIQVIPNPAPQPIENSQLAPTEDYCVFVAAGQFQRKGLFRLLEALQQVQPSWTLRIVGGDEVEVRHARSDAKQLAPHVKAEFVGHSADPRTHMRTARALIVASDYEVMPMVMLESLSVGTPVVSTPVGGTDELINSGINGVVARSLCVEDLASALLDFDALYARRSSQMREASLEVAQRFGPAEFAARWASVLSEVQ